MKELTEKDKTILGKLAPELEGATGPAHGHNFNYILLPVSHKFAESPEDFAARVNKLTDNELEYLCDRIIQGEEDVRSLSEGDFDEMLGVVEKRLSREKKEELINR